MNKARLEAFSDGVVAIIITIMVLALKAPPSPDWNEIAALGPLLFSYVLSFVFVGIYWVNHHHLFQPVQRVNGMILWANLHLLFWLSLIPFVTAWAGAHPLMPVPAALYGAVLLMCSVAFLLLVRCLLSKEGDESRLARALGKSRKNQLSILLYALAIPLSLWQAAVGSLVYVVVAVLWFVPDRRIEQLRRD
jgi:uncharacterized membrane protein